MAIGLQQDQLSQWKVVAENDTEKSVTMKIYKRKCAALKIFSAISVNCSALFLADTVRSLE